jgi:sugar phosphate isomerase/epimerase
MLWGYANGWFPEYLGQVAGDRLRARIAFLRRWGFRETGCQLDELINRNDSDLARLGDELAEDGLHVTPMVGFDYVGADDDTAARETDRLAKQLDRLRPVLHNWTVFTRAGCGHRFDHEPPVEEKLDRLCRRLAPLATACRDMGTPLGINNQGDFYIRDFIALCERTPGLFVHLDTANIFWGGEPIHPAFDEVAPYVIGTHWRDEKITIGQRIPRGVLLHNIVTGQGDVGLESCFEILKAKAPQPDRLVMELELFPQSGIDRIEALRQAIGFLRTAHGADLRPSV